ncbi:unnamed protein product [Knipowitschia caucasica]
MSLKKEHLTTAENDEEVCLSTKKRSQEEEEERARIKEEEEERARIKEEEEERDTQLFVPEYITVRVKSEEEPFELKQESFEPFEPKQEPCDLKSEEPQGEDLKAEPQSDPETEGGTDHSSNSDQDWTSPVRIDGDQENQDQIGLGVR